MKNLAFCFLLFLFAVIAWAEYPDSVKFMTYNINAESHGSGSYRDIAAVINEIKPDINGIQKLDSCNSRNSSYVLEYLGEQTGMNYTFAAAITNYNGSTGSYGIGFLSVEDPLSIRRLSLSSGTSSEKRAALEIGISMAGTPVRVVVTHLDNASASNRTLQLKEIVDWIDSVGSEDDPLVIMADFNAKSTESSMKVLTDAGFVFVKDSNGEIMDTSQGINHILYRPESKWTVEDVGNPAYSASNRYPLWAILKLTAASTTIPAKTSLEKSPKISLVDRTLFIQMNTAENISLSLFDLSGNRICSLVQNEKLSTGLHLLDLPLNLPQGLLLLKGKADGKNFVRTLSIVR
ncbi:MAG: hypothetical protein M0P13_02995 [Fibrobacteraceae bacterium]|nr:hypothetical protein [Fibrobacteraceae bacterium]